MNNKAAVILISLFFVATYLKVSALAIEARVDQDSLRQSWRHSFRIDEDYPSNVYSGMRLYAATSVDEESVKEEVGSDDTKGATAGQEVLWEAGGGLRLNYLRLTGGFSGYDAENDHSFSIDYDDIGMSNYAPSLGLALGGKYKKWNLFFGASRGSYTGSFTTKTDITIDGETIPAGSDVDGEINIGIYSLSTTYALVRRQHDVGIGLGFLFLDMETTFETQGKKIGGRHLFPMPFLALSGRLNFDRWRLSAVGGGAYFNGKVDGLDYTVWYTTVDVQGTYEIMKKKHWSTLVSLGYRHLYMYSEARKDGSRFNEEDRYQGPFASLRVRYTEFTEIFK